MAPDEKHYNPIGMVHGGVTATLLDSAMGCAVQSLLPAGVGYSTLDISVRYLRPITVAHRHRRRDRHGRAQRPAYGDRRRRALVDETLGQVLATATSTLMVLS